MTWNRRYRVKSYIQSALWIVPLVALLLEQVLAALVHAVDTRLAWKGLGLGVTGAQPLFNAIVTLTLSLGCRSLWIKQSSYQDDGAAAAGKSSP